MDRIALRGVRAYGRHGANPGERENPQAFDLDVTAEIDLRAAQASDELADTLDYAELYGRLVEVVASTSHALLERLGGDLLEAILPTLASFAPKSRSQNPAFSTARRRR